MPITLLKTRQPDTRVVLPRSHGVEPRDTERFPIPPRGNLGIVLAIVTELRELGHAVECHVEHERLADWTKTNAANERSWGSEDSWRPDPKGPTVLRFVAGGSRVTVVVDGRETILTAEMLRMSRQALRIILAGRA